MSNDPHQLRPPTWTDVRNGVLIGLGLLVGFLYLIHWLAG